MRNRRYFLNMLLALVLVVNRESVAQKTGLPYDTIGLRDFSSFTTASEWQLAGSVSSSPGSKELKTKEGSGILVSKRGGANLISVFQHGDLDIELEFLLAPGTKSGLWLMGKYEIVLSDSWQQNQPDEKSSGAISGNSTLKFYDEVPRANAAKAPGTWQKLSVSFIAPKFNAGGEKISPARMESIYLNGFLIHENIEIPAPSLSTHSSTEQEKGPLVFQSANPGIAFRNIRFKNYTNPPFPISNINAVYVEGSFAEYEDIDKARPLISKTNLPVLTFDFGKNPDDYGYRFTFDAHIETSGNYVFYPALNGKTTLLIDGNKVFSTAKEIAYITNNPFETTLSKGIRHFTFYYSKNNKRSKPAFGLFAEGPGIKKFSLSDPKDLPNPNSNAKQITIAPQGKTRVFRSFLSVNNTVKPYCISVGEPAGIHFSYDLRNGALLQAWKGDFLDVSDMWNDRGSQVAHPLGGVVALDTKPSVAFLTSAESAWPDSLISNLTIKQKGYRLDKQHRPTFSYVLNGALIEDKIIPDAAQSFLIRNIKISSISTQTPAWCKLAEGKDIRKQDDGTYLVNETYLIDYKGKEKIFIRERNGTKELLLQVAPKLQSAYINYSIIW